MRRFYRLDTWVVVNTAAFKGDPRVRLVEALSDSLRWKDGILESVTEVVDEGVAPRGMEDSLRDKVRGQQPWTRTARSDKADTKTPTE